MSPAALPEGERAPADGSIPAAALAELGERRFGFYIHVPYCTTRCGYCDFNTYTADELGPAVRRQTYAATVIREITLARRVITGQAPVSTVFFGGGTPTLLSPEDLGAILAAIDGEFGLAPTAEVTTEANPESVDLGYLERLRMAGFTRISFGMQSARQHVLDVLDRQHRPGRAEQCVRWARRAGFHHINLDLIYGTPGETEDDWLASLGAAIDAGVDHISAYSLIVEPGTRLAARIRRGELPMPDDDVLADRYVIADDVLSGAGFAWYEVSNWARSAADRCRHNMLYWTGGNWWGAGPGAHSHIGGVRWWNVKHPAAYARRLATGESPAQARELLSEDERRVEQIMLGVRLSDGYRLNDIGETGQGAAKLAVADGLASPDAYAAGRLILTRRGRLLADALALQISG